MVTQERCFYIIQGASLNCACLWDLKLPIRITAFVKRNKSGIFSGVQELPYSILQLPLKL